MSSKVFTPIVNYSQIAGMRPGVARRTAFIQYLARQLLSDTPEYARLPVNTKWTLQTYDQDLKYLLKHGKLKQIRTGGCTSRAKKSFKRQTYLVLP